MAILQRHAAGRGSGHGRHLEGHQQFTVEAVSILAEGDRGGSLLSGYGPGPSAGRQEAGMDAQQAGRGSTALLRQKTVHAGGWASLKLLGTHIVRFRMISNRSQGTMFIRVP